MLVFFRCRARILTAKRRTASPQFDLGRYPCPPIDAVLCPVACDTALVTSVCLLGVADIPYLNSSPSAAASLATGPPCRLTIEMQGQLSGIHVGDIHA